MRILGILLLLFGVGTLVVYFMNLQVNALAWIDNWGEGVAWAIRGGSLVLGLMLFASGKKGVKKK